LPEVAIADRLKVYGLTEQQVQLEDLHVAAGQSQVLTGDSPELRPHVVQLHPQSVEQLKSWIGVPDEAITHLRALDTGTAPVAVFHPLPEELTASDHSALHTLARTFVFGNSTAVGISPQSLSEWISRIGTVINQYVFRDIEVAANARLIVAPDVFVLFARYITVHPTGRIIVRGTSTRIDCAGFTDGVQHQRIIAQLSATATEALRLMAPH
jgi:hypothetical protein